MAPSVPDHRPARDLSANGSGAQASPASVAADEVDVDQIIERLQWTPRQRLDYLLDMLAFEERARRARCVS